MKEITLSQDKVTLVDDEDYDFLVRWKWYAHKSRSTFYATRNRRLDDPVGPCSITAHSLLLSIEVGEGIVDHIDGNGLNNQRVNLRVASFHQNAVNRRYSVGQSGYRGVRKNGNHWTARIRVNRKVFGLGTFVDPMEAALAYDVAATEHFGEFAILNFQ